MLHDISIQIEYSYYTQPVVRNVSRFIYYDSAHNKIDAQKQTFLLLVFKCFNWVSRAQKQF
jgi:hypothetical protein